MNLKFSKPTKMGEVFVQTAFPTGEFWALWRRSKEQMADSGISVQQVLDSNKRVMWVVIRTSKNDFNEKLIPVKTTPAPLKDTEFLFKYQIPNVCMLKASLISNRIAVDGSDTGTGKTYMALKVCKELGLRPCIICTKNGIGGWKKACNYMGIKPLFIVNWEFAKSKSFPYKAVSVNPYTNDYLFKWLVPSQIQPVFIFDEVHRAKTTGTQNQEMLIAAKSYFMILCSATLTDKPDKFRAMGSLLGFFKLNEYDNWLKKMGLFKDSRNNWISLESSKVMQSLNKMIYPKFGGRIDKNEVPDFPECQNLLKPIEIDGAHEQNESYELLLKQINEIKSGVKSEVKKTELVLRLRYRQLAEHKKIPVIIEFAKELKDQGFSVVIFLNFRASLESVAKSLKTNCVIFGSQKESEREKSKSDFQSNKSRVIVVNSQAGGTSIDLHDLHGGHPRASIISPTDDPVVLSQVMGRIHRAGSKTKSINYLVYAMGTVEEKVYSNVSNKINDINTLNSGELIEKGSFN